MCKKDKDWIIKDILEEDAKVTAYLEKKIFRIFKMIGIKVWINNDW